MTTAIYPGTFDPMTLGHVNIIERGIKLFDRVLVAVAPGTHKSPMFSLEQRIDLARQVIEPFSSQVEVISIEGLLVKFAKIHDATVILRGLRTANDFEYEYQLSGMNRQLAPDIETVFLTPEDRYQCISSTLVREVSRLGGDAHLFVPPVVNEALLERLKHGFIDY
jgi:pantetheine-phosphate adenylyltransferase